MLKNYKSSVLKIIHSTDCIGRPEGSRVIAAVKIQNIYI